MKRRDKGTGCLYRRGQTWWIKYYDPHGRARQESTLTTSKTKAQEKLKIALGKCATGTLEEPQIKRITIDELAENFFRDYRINGKRSLNTTEARWRLHLAPFFGGMKAVNVTSEQLARYVDERQQQDATNATINRELSALKRMFSLGFKVRPQKVMQIPPFPRLAEDNIRQGFLEDETYYKLIENTELWFRALIECGRSYGWRLKELLSMRVSQADVSQRVIRLEPGTTKNRDGREVIMSTTIFELLSALVEGKQPDSYVFTRSNGKRVKDFTKTWKNICTKAGVPKLLFHDLRRTGARNMRRAGISEGLIMRIGGWKTRSVFDRYNIIDRRDMANAVRQLEEHEKKLAEARISYNLSYSAPSKVQTTPPTKPTNPSVVN
jgi:integrase